MTNPWERLRKAAKALLDSVVEFSSDCTARYEIGLQEQDDLREAIAALPTNPPEHPANSQVSLNKLPPRAVKFAFYDEPRSDARLDGDATLRDWLDHKHNPLGDPLEGVVAELARRALHT